MAKPKLALIPAAQGDKFYSVLPSDGVGDFQFSRLSSGTRIAPTGLIETVTIATSRLNYDLLNDKVVNCPHYLLEPARTNLLPYSEDFSNAAWTKYRTSILSNNAISPDGTLNADKLVDNSVNSTHAIEERRYSLSSGSEYTYSFFAKANEIKQVGLLGSSPNQGSIFDLENGIVYGDFISAPNSSKIENFGNGWYRCSITTTLTGTDSKFGIYLAKNGSTNYSGNGTDGLYIYGAQLEQGSYLTSYIPTNGTTISRIAESADFSGDAATFNDSEGVLMVEGNIPKDENVYRNISISDGSSNNFVTFYTTNTLNKITYLLGAGGQGAVFGLDYFFQDITIPFKIALVYSSGRNEIWVNGIKVNQNSNTFNLMSGLNQLSFDNGTGGGNWYGNTRELQYFDTTLTDAQLETLTSWTSLQEMITSQLYTNY